MSTQTASKTQSWVKKSLIFVLVLGMLIIFLPTPTAQAYVPRTPPPVPPPYIANQDSLLRAGVNSSFDYDFYLSGGKYPVVWSVSGGSLPKGMSLNSSGKLSGTSAVPGRYAVSITVTDARGFSDSKNYQFTIVPGTANINLPGINNFQLKIGENFKQEIPCGCTPGVAYNWSLGWGSLPAGLSLNPATGVISGTPITVDTYATDLYLADDYGQKTSVRLNFTVSPQPLTITTPANLPNGSREGADYSQTFSAIGGVAPYKWSVPGVILNVNQVKWALPVQIPDLGLMLDQKTGTVYGRLGKYGTLNFTVKVTDKFGVSATKTMTLKVMPAPPTIAIVGMDAPVKALPTLWINSNVGYTPVGSFNIGYPTAYGAGPLTWSVVKGALPPGITIDSAGKETGRPTTPGTYYFTLTVTDSYGQSVTKDAVQSVLVPSYSTQCAYESCNADGSPNTLPSPVINTSSFPSASQNSRYSQSLLVSGGKAPYTFALAYGSGSLPAGLTLNSSTGLISGTPTTLGTGSFTIKVTDSNNRIAAKLLYIEVNKSSAPTTAVVAPAAPASAPPVVFAPVAPAPVVNKIPALAKTPTPAPIVVTPAPAPTPVPTLTTTQPASSIGSKITGIAEAIKGAMNQAVKSLQTGLIVSVGTLSGFLQGAASLVEGAATLIIHPIDIDRGNAIINMDVGKISDAVLQGLKARYSAIVYIDENNYVSMYNAGVAVGQTVFDVCTVACTLGTGVEVRGTQVGKIAVDVNSANKAAEVAKISEAIKTAEQGIKVAQVAIKSSNIIFTDKILGQITQRGWTMDSVKALINNPFTTRVGINKTTIINNPATIFYAKNGTYVSVDNITKEIIQVTDNAKVLRGEWFPDSSIVNPYIP